MLTRISFKRTIVAMAAAFTMSTVTVGAAVAPAQASVASAINA